ncbi:hypothetical protein E2C01_038956 [Portunus trituberculatus]|uniref:Uncharacterized protein n=1 Tax=Portunus trituberculatus TaxID=210409 RepID=A0A5B7FDH7_PORTR|nr:hypothetical protein [Portunus trituberculatus]
MEVVINITKTLHRNKYTLNIGGSSVADILKGKHPQSCIRNTITRHDTGVHETSGGSILRAARHCGLGLVGREGLGFEFGPYDCRGESQCDSQPVVSEGKHN